MANSGFRNQHEEFLVGLETVHREMLVRRRRTASQFNVFGALGLTGLELPHSTFLRFLLAPSEQHGQGELFLKTFLERIVKIESEDLGGTLVVSERVLADSGRIDIAIRLPNDRIVLIENKVGAAEGEAQIERYLEWLGKQKPSGGGEHKLLFLTSDARIPISTKNPDKVVPLSYCDIADWLSSVVEEVPERLRTVLDQYIQTCLRVGGKMQDDTMELRGFLKNLQNFELGFDVSKVVEEIRKEAHLEFWKYVEINLHRKVASSDAAGLWEAFDNRSNNGLIGIGWKNNKKGNDSFSVSFESRGGLTHYGIFRGKKVMVPDNEDVKIIGQLKMEGFLSNEWWAGLRYLHNHDQAFTPNSEKKLAIALLSDNRSLSHPLAAKVAEVAWELFARYQQPLEDLNRSYPY